MYSSVYLFIYLFIHFFIYSHIIYIYIFFFIAAVYTKICILLQEMQQYTLFSALGGAVNIVEFKKHTRVTTAYIDPNQPPHAGLPELALKRPSLAGESIFSLLTWSSSTGSDPVAAK